MSISAMLSEDGMDQNRRLLWFMAKGGALLLCGMAFCTDALDEEVGGVGMESWGKGYVGQG